VFRQDNWTLKTLVPRARILATARQLRHDYAGWAAPSRRGKLGGLTFSVTTEHAVSKAVQRMAARLPEDKSRGVSFRKALRVLEEKGC